MKWEASYLSDTNMKQLLEFSETAWKEVHTEAKAQARHILL